MNPVEIEEAVSALVELEFDAAEFPYQFLAAFGNKPTTIKRLRSGNTNKSDVVGGVLQRNNIHIAVCDPGLVEATLPALRESTATASQKAKYILATDGETVEAESVEDGETLACSYAELANHFGFFLPLAGITTVKQIRENAFDIKATSRLNKLYVELLKQNPDWEKRREELNHFFARLIFCFFAEDTNIFHSDNLFTATIEQMTASDSSNTHEVIAELFRAMNTKHEQRKDGNFRPWANTFPYVNGGLFTGSLDVPRFSKIARSYLLHIGNLDWTKINPDIFGSMIQAVAEDEERGELGMHYTSVPNILKVLNPLFLDELRETLEAAGDGSDQGSKRKLLNLRNRMARIRVFDPACGSGNFLVIAYKEMRAIEAEINQRRGEAERHSDIPLTNFRGIEIRHFAAEIARLALIIAEYQCDVVYRGPKLALAEFLPLEAANWIENGNALRLNWHTVCPPWGMEQSSVGDNLFAVDQGNEGINFENEGGEVYICGNPPYAGLSSQAESQKDDLRDLFDGVSKYWKSFDYVSGWFWKASQFLKDASGAAAFVATNSICQGQQVPMFWPHVLLNGIRIKFAHTSFKWRNLATNNAGVTVVIVGLSLAHRGPCVLLSSDPEGISVATNTQNLNAYLVPSANVYVNPLPAPPSDRPTMFWGNKPTDGGHLILKNEEARQIVNHDTQCSQFIKPLYGSAEYINGIPRACIWVTDSEASAANAVPELARRFESVRSFRQASKAKETRPAAEYPHRFRQIQGEPGAQAIVIPIHSSESRPYLPVGPIPAGSIVSNAAYALYGSDLWAMSVIASRMHIVWVATVCGKLETRYRYSNTLGWNTFPLPPLTENNRIELGQAAKDILLARESYWPASIADLYDREHMDVEFPEVCAAHDRNDEILERIYIGRRFKNDTERLEKLFELYTNTKMMAKAGGK